jgi:glycosyltransferase involved in cell wall biosynthesis
MPFLSVIIPTYNRKQSLLRTLEALKGQTLPPDQFEVVVVSDGSMDGTADAVRTREYPFRTRVLEQMNSGPSVARNLGARAACGEVIVYLDDDIEPVSIFLEEHAKAQREDDHLVLIGPQSMPPKERYPVWIAWEHRMLERQYVRFRSGEWHAGPNNLYSGNFSVRREHLIQAGGFDEKFKRQEDVELGFRLEALGLHFRFEYRADGYHRPERSYDSWYDTPYLYGVRDVQMARDKGQEQAFVLARKHYGERNLLTRVLAKTCVGKPGVEGLLFGILRPAGPAIDRLGLRRVALVVLSLTFNLRYLQGMAKEIGGARRMWASLKPERA